MMANERFNLIGGSAGVIAQKAVELYPQCMNYVRGYMYVIITVFSTNHVFVC